MTITLNGQVENLAEKATVIGLLKLKNLEGKPVAVELNGQALIPENFEKTLLSENDAIEIIVFAAGG